MGGDVKPGIFSNLILFMTAQVSLAVFVKGQLDTLYKANVAAFIV